MPRPVSHRETVRLHTGYMDRASGETWYEAEIRPVTGADELAIGRSRDYAEHDSDLMYKYLLLARTITRLGPSTSVSLDVVRALKLRDIDLLDQALFELTYGGDLPPPPEVRPGTVHLPVGYEDPASGSVHHEAEIREICGGDEIAIGKSADYKLAPNQLVYKVHLLSYTVTRLGPRKLVTLSDIERLHAYDVRELERAVYRLTYGADAVPEDGAAPG